MDGEINSTHKPCFKDEVEIWRSITRWLHAPVSGFADKYTAGHMGNAENLSLTLCRQMDDAFSFLMDSPSFRAMLRQFPEIEDIKVYFADLKAQDKDYNGLYAYDTKRIILDISDRSLDQDYGYVPHFFSVASHEYRHAFQHCVRLRHKQNPAVDYGLSHLYAMRGYIDEADANAFQCTVAYELKKLCDIDIFWNHYSTKKPEIAWAFHAMVDRDERTAWNGTAQQAAFLAFFQTTSSMNFYARDYAQKLEDAMSVSPREQAEKIWRKRRVKEIVNELIKPKNGPKALPAPGQIFTQAAQAPPQKQPGNENHNNGAQTGLMGFEIAEGQAIQARPLYGNEDFFPADSLDFYLQKLGDKEYARLLALNEKIRQYEVDVNVELGKMSRRHHGVRPLF